MAFGRLFDPRHGPFGDLQHDMNELFDSLVTRYGGLAHGLIPRAFPPVNILENQEALLIECELPGVEPGSLDLSITGDVLTLKGERLKPVNPAGTTEHIQERTYGAFNRAITLPVGVDNDHAEAKFANGVLSLRLPKLPEARPRQVAVKIQQDENQAPSGGK